MGSADRTKNLILKARAGDRDAFDNVAARFRDRLQAFVQSRLGAPLRQKVEVADVVQETLLRAFGSLERYGEQDDDSFFRWLGGIATNVIREVARHEKRDLILPLVDDLPSSAASPSKEGARQERFERLQGSLAALSPDHRQVILLARIERLPIKEVARKMNRSPQAVTQLLWRALRKLKEAFGSTDSFHLPPRRLENDGDCDERNDAT